MTNKNDITGDSLVSKASTESYRSGWDNIFKKKDTPMKEYEEDEPQERSDDDGEWCCERCGGPMYRQAHWSYGQCDDCGARQELVDDEYI
jgi:hypothetical protein